MANDSGDQGGASGGGYGKPPKHSQFKPGKSGNPRGRPRKAKSAATALPAILPTAAALRAQALALVSVRDGENRLEMPTREAVIKALGFTAMKGGVMAQKAWIDLMMAEDARYAAEKRANFEVWQRYVERAREAIQRAKARGVEPPNLVPHPDDVVFTYIDLEVQIVGPLTEEAAMHAVYCKRLNNLMYEMMIYHQEDLSKGDGDLRMGLFGACYFEGAAALPPRLRQLSPEFLAAMERRTYLPRQWEQYLRDEHDALGLPFAPFRKPLPVFSVRELSERLPREKRAMVHDWLEHLAPRKAG